MISSYILKKYNFKVDFKQLLTVLHYIRRTTESYAVQYNRETGTITTSKISGLPCDITTIYGCSACKHTTAAKLILKIQKEIAAEECKKAKQNCWYWDNESSRKNYIYKKAKYLAIKQKHDKLFRKNAA